MLPEILSIMSGTRLWCSLYFHLRVMTILLSLDRLAVVRRMSDTSLAIQLDHEHDYPHGLTAIYDALLLPSWPINLLNDRNFVGLAELLHCASLTAASVINEHTTTALHTIWRKIACICHATHIATAYSSVVDSHTSFTAVPVEDGDVTQADGIILCFPFSYGTSQNEVLRRW